jgi:alpha-galactosidase
MYLGAVRQNTTYCLDPRYPEVRKYLTEIYRNAVVNYGLDGLKLDFIDSFNLTPEAMKEYERRDYSSLEDAIDRLLSDVTEALKAIRPDILIEFRQSYIGPRIRKYGNMLRVADCPNDLIRNRVSSIDLRLISGGSAVHSDMIMWHPEESVEYASHQLLGIMFAVPQISLRLENHPEEHKNLIKYYLSFWREHRATLLDGQLTAMNPEDNYSLVSSQLNGEQIAVRYAAVPFKLKGDTEKAFLFNASADTLTVIASETELCGRKYIIRDNLGKTVSTDRFGTGTNAIVSVPVTGSIEIC